MQAAPLAFADTDGDARRRARRGLAIYFAIVVVLSAAIEGFIILNPSMDGLIAVLMFVPAIASVVARLALGEGFSDVSFRLGGRRGLGAVGIALVFPVAIGLVAYGIAWTTGLAGFDARPSSGMVVSFAVGLVIGLVLAAGEEIGWRGYLLPLLADRRSASAAVGVLHGVWHLPLIIFTTSYNPAGSRWITIPVMLGVFAGAGVFYGYLRLASASTWPVVLAHQSFNSVSEWFAGKAGPEGGDTMAYAVGETGVITLVLVALLAAALLTRRSEPAATPERTV